MFVDFFYHLRSRGLNVSITEFMTLLEALEAGHAEASLNRFYTLARSVLVKRPEQYDIYDQAFAEFFKDAVVEWDELPQLHDQLADWLKDPKTFRDISPEEIAELERHDLDELRKMFEERLNEQEERHDGGDRWVGTGGTSPFGHGGANPAGIRVGGPGGGRSAVQVAMDRRFRNLRDDLVLDVRQFSTALKKLRILTRDGRQEELDLEGTIDQTARNAGDIELVFEQPRKNQVKLLLLCDVGGSMNPYTHLTSLLFSAAHKASHFKHFESYYFHNCVYGKLYTDMARRKSKPTEEVLSQVDQTWRCIIVGDAAMAPYELMDSGGAIDFYYMNKDAGITWLRRIKEKIPRTVWLNPDPPKYWGSTYSTITIAKIFDMFPFTLEGLDDAIRELRSTRVT
jgi:uncharacterized protein with von Willebrand factor type A (vWA) domain